MITRDNSTFGGPVQTNNGVNKTNTYEEYGDTVKTKGSPAHSSPTANRGDDKMI